MIENDEFAGEYSKQLVRFMTVEQREKAFKFLETFFDEKTVNCMKQDAQSIINIRADMDRRLAEMDAKTNTQ